MKFKINKTIELPLYLQYDKDWQIMILSEEELIVVNRGQVEIQGIVSHYMTNDSYKPSTKENFLDSYNKTIEELNLLIK